MLMRSTWQYHEVVIVSLKLYDLLLGLSVIMLTSKILWCSLLLSRNLWMHAPAAPILMQALDLFQAY